ncbi:hypothetical protein QZH41_019015 [Actinostola sp. cb2023]|nr:hypothetical protein QZH41_019015 [Actinostola sp. cb2023]
MSINKIECSDGRLTLHGDYVVYHQDGVQFELLGDGIPGFLKGSRKGNIFVSTNRVIFAPMAMTEVGSFSMNFQSIRGVEVKQPMFGANFIKGDVISEPEGQNCFHYNVFGINDEDGGDGQLNELELVEDLWI